MCQRRVDLIGAGLPAQKATFTAAFGVVSLRSIFQKEQRL
jgi:hypothetical protein